MNVDQYEQNSVNTIEKVVLAEAVKFSLPSKHILGKFNIPLMMPNAKSGSALSNPNGRYKSSNYVQLYIPKHLLWSFIKPTFITIPTSDSDSTVKTKKLPPLKALSIPESTTIPKGTIFLAEYLGGKKDITMLRIIGVHVDSINEED